MKIILVGYMASGKTTIGKLISKALELPFYDLDILIEKEFHLKINEIFEQKGELLFRKKEREVLESFLSKTDNYILALGGGTPCYFDNFTLYQKDDIRSFYLKAPVATLEERLKNQKNSRPIIANFSNDALKEFVAKHIFERSFFYNKTQTVIATDNKSEQEIVSEILFKLT